MSADAEGYTVVYIDTLTNMLANLTIRRREKTLLGKITLSLLELNCRKYKSHLNNNNKVLIAAKMLSLNGL